MSFFNGTGNDVKRNRIPIPHSPPRIYRAAAEPLLLRNISRLSRGCLVHGGFVVLLFLLAFIYDDILKSLARAGGIQRGRHST
ncbi:MAG: hypothetical protein HY238_22985 [Acidobacteria bacterium]|nr:hypothetical protein [Acidobacteriota bacterium]